MEVKERCFSDIGVLRSKAGATAKTIRNHYTAGKRGCAIPSKVIVGYRTCSFGLAAALPSLPEGDRFTAVWKHLLRGVDYHMEK